MATLVFSIASFCGCNNKLLPASRVSVEIMLVVSATRIIIISLIALMGRLESFHHWSSSQARLLEMLLGMLEFLLFHESTEAMKDVSLMHGYENGKHGGYGNERKFL